MIKKISFIILVMLCCFRINVCAKSSINDLYQMEEKLIVDKEIDGTAFLAGDKIELNNKINGIGFLAGNEIKINNTQDYIFGIGNKINVYKDIEKDLFLFSSVVNFNGNVKRDAYIAGETLNLDGIVERNIYIYGTEVNLKGTFNGNVNINATTINIDDSAKILGTLKYNQDATISGLNDSINTKTYDASSENISLKEYISNFITSYIHITILAIVLMFISEKVFKKSLKQTKEINIKNLSILCGKGFLILIGVPIIVLMLLFSGMFISVGVIGGIIYGILLYISEIFTAYFIANLINKKYIHKTINGYLLLIMGLFIIRILGYIPVLGGFISLISILLGLGMLGNMIIEIKNNG